MRRLIFVTTWYGPDTIGGAEILAARLAEEMQQAGYPVEVWTTTARGYTYPWFESYYPEGTQEWNGVAIRRFPICRWEEATFFDERKDLLRGLPVFPPDEVAHLVEMPQSDGLYRAISREREATFVFFVYSHNLGFWGAQIAPERSFLLPCLHDEPYAYHEATALLMRQVRGLLCISEPEHELAVRLYSLPPKRVHMVGAGVDTGWRGDAERFRAWVGIEGPFLLYVGRRDSSKLIQVLVQFFCAYKERHPGDLRLLLAGPGEVSVSPDSAGYMMDLGVLSEQEKHDAYAAATLLCQPSQIESYSIVLMESWLQGTPVLVNAGCEVTVAHCRRSNGGLYYRDYAEFEVCLDYLLQRPELRRKMGEAGRAYVLEHHTWPAMVGRIVQALETAEFDAPPAPGR